MEDATRGARNEGLWNLMYLVIIAESEEESVRKFGIRKREMETRGFKVNMNKTNLMVIVREPTVKPQGRIYPCGVCGVGGNSIYSSVKDLRWYHQKCLTIGNLRRAGNNFRCLTCVRGIVAVLQRLEVGGSLEIVDSFHNLGDVISCGEGLELAVRDRIYPIPWNKWRVLASFLVNHSFP